MLNPPPELLPAGKNARLFAYLNALLRWGKQYQIRSGPGYAVEHTPNGFTLALKPTRGGSSRVRVQRFCLKGVPVQGDYLKCLPWVQGFPIPGQDFVAFPEDGYDVAELVFVDKVPELQKTLFHGKTVDGWLYDVIDVTPPVDDPLDAIIFGGIRRHATNGIKKEIQQVIPKYRLDWPIYAITGIEGASSGNAWLELNQGRAFAKTLERVEEDGTFGTQE